jgi:serine/threonine protein phosphatase PrpC
MLQSSFIAVSAQGGGQDRIQLVRLDGGVIFALADGAGGRSGGAEAADLATQLILKSADLLTTQEHCECLLRTIDGAISADRIAGETTAIVAVVKTEKVFGASVGDSGTWVLNGSNIDDLTVNQVRKPFLGSGAAMPVGFSRDRLYGTLLIATDGLLKYTSREAIAGVVEKSDLNEAPEALVNLVRYTSGNLPDDVAIALCRSI